jgi:protein-tyrosine phosphatase
VIDLHCHLLPEIDDGPQDIEEALALSKLAAENGVQWAAVTPHIRPGRWNNDSEVIQNSLQAFRSELRLHGIPLNLTMAAEVRICGEFLNLLAENRIPFLGNFEGQRVLLLEFPSSHIPVGTEKLFHWLISQNIKPLIAHPERNKTFMHDPSKLIPYIKLGCLFQVTAGSLIGQFGPGANKLAIDLLEANLITILASDTHNIRHRPPNLMLGYEAARQRIGKTKAWQLVYDTPSKIIRSSC